MGKPLAIFGEVDESIKNSVIDLRKKIETLGYTTGEQYIYTVPHLTLAVNKDFDGDPSQLKSRVEDLKISNFNLTITDFIAVEKNIAAKFDNTYSKELAANIADTLKMFSFERVDTYFMKLIRSEVKDQFQEEVKEMLKRIIPEKLEIIKISAAGKEIRQEDTLWSINLD